MFLSPYPEKDGMKVWLDEREVDAWIAQADDTEQRIAFQLMAYSGLRSKEVLEVTPEHVQQTLAGPRVTVYDGKTGHRETIASNELLTLANAMEDTHDRGHDDALVSVSSRRTLRRWTKRAASRMIEITDDPRWGHLTPHDLRGTWVTLLMHDYQVDPLLCCDWGGWEKLETLLEHYRGTYSVNVQRRELSAVPWISADIDERSGISKNPKELGEFSTNPENLESSI